MTCKTEHAIRPSGEFIQERRYLTNVSSKTVVFYGCAFNAFDGALELEQAKQRVVELRQPGVKSVSVNTYLTCINAYWKWNGLAWKIPPLKEEQKILATFTREQVLAFHGYKPQGTNMMRAHVVSSRLLDTGVRISEALGLNRSDIDMESMTLRAEGNGGKHRLVPFSCQLRRLLYRYFQKQTAAIVFATEFGTAMTVRNLERDFKVLGKKVGITGVRMSLHPCRHSFACGYLRKGGIWNSTEGFWGTPRFSPPRSTYGLWAWRISRRRMIGCHL